jgi:3-hydroxypropanoate dehydrogenase
MAAALPDPSLDQLFRTARSFKAWKDEPVPEALIRAVYELTKLGPTSANMCPARFVWLVSEAAKKRLEPHLHPNNVKQVLGAPVCVIIAYDYNFREKFGTLLPAYPAVKDWFADPAFAVPNAIRNGTLQGAYLMLAARSLGLDCGPMSGFDPAGVNKEFFTDDESAAWHSDFICSIGYGSEEGLGERYPRLDFDQANRIL